MLNTINQIDTESYNIIIAEQKLKEPALEEVKMAVGVLKDSKTMAHISIMPHLQKNEISPQKRKFSPI